MGMTRTVVGEAETIAELRERIERLEAGLARLERGVMMTNAVVEVLAEHNDARIEAEAAHVTDCCGMGDCDCGQADDIHGSFAGAVGPV